MYQPSHATTEIGRMRAAEMRDRAERYRTIQKARQHKKAEPEEEVSFSRSRTVVYRKALGIAGLSVLMVLVFAGAALAMPLDSAPPSDVDGKHQALITKAQVREGPASVFEAESQLSTKIEPVSGVTSSSGGIELEMVLLLTGAVAAASLGALAWFRRHTINTA